MGSTRIARRAGTLHAAAATATNTIGTTINVSGSLGVTPYSNIASGLVAARAETTPTATPINANFSPWPMTRAITCGGLAPSAVRIPISRVRWETRCDITPYIPIAPKNMARAPKKTIILARTRFPVSTTVIKVSSGSTEEIGWSRSTAQIESRMAVAIVVEFPAVRTTKPSVAEGNCAKGTYICRSGRGRSWYILMFLTIPTIVQTVRCSPKRSWCPIGSSLGHNCRARVSLMIADGELPCASAEVNTRPLTRPICMAEK